MNAEATRFAPAFKDSQWSVLTDVAQTKRLLFATSMTPAIR